MYVYTVIHTHTCMMYDDAYTAMQAVHCYAAQCNIMHCSMYCNGTERNEMSESITVCISTHVTLYPIDVHADR